MIVLVEGINSKEKARSLIGKTAIWTSPGKNKKQLKGRISAVHGSKGAIRAIFETGMPGQSLGEPVNIE
jgi:large subunit ribosomal protein L35Ae